MTPDDAVPFLLCRIGEWGGDCSFLSQVVRSGFCLAFPLPAPVCMIVIEDRRDFDQPNATRRNGMGVWQTEG